MVQVSIVLVIALNEHSLHCRLENSSAHARMISGSSNDLEYVVPTIACIRVDATRAESVLSHLEASSGHSQSLNLCQTVQVDHPAD